MSSSSVFVGRKQRNLGQRPNAPPSLSLRLRDYEARLHENRNRRDDDEIMEEATTARACTEDNPEIEILLLNDFHELPPTLLSSLGYLSNEHAQNQLCINVRAAHQS